MSNKPLQPHIKVSKVDEYCLIAGNPDRVPVIASYLKDTEKVADHRGLPVFKGKTPTKEIPVTVVTTGMGTPSTAIVLEEIYRAGGKTIIRIGSTGSLLPNQDHGIGSIYIPYGAIRDDGASRKIAPLEVPAVAFPDIFQALCKTAESMNIKYFTGLVWTSDIYYNENPDHFKVWVPYNATCVEMESSFLFTFGLKRNLRTGTILTSDGNLNDSKSIYTGEIKKHEKQFEIGVKNTITCAIITIENLAHE
ncbi:MAG: nucleoside phosphorylase [Candidatus Hodarchaeales archaeon]|jgi:uridine phosphorylase